MNKRPSSTTSRFADVPFRAIRRLAFGPDVQQEPGVGGSGPTMDLAAGTDDATRLLDSYKYRAYLVVITRGMTSAVVSWWLGRAAGRVGVSSVTNPALALFCVLLLALLL